jgi:hypothetical protein
MELQRTYCVQETLQRRSIPRRLLVYPTRMQYLARMVYVIAPLYPTFLGLILSAVIRVRRSQLAEWW